MIYSDENEKIELLEEIPVHKGDKWNDTRAYVKRDSGRDKSTRAEFSLSPEQHRDLTTSSRQDKTINSYQCDDHKKRVIMRVQQPGRDESRRT